MSALVSGDDGICPGAGGLFCSKHLMDSSLFLSLAPPRSGDVYCPTLKRTRVSAPFIFQQGGDHKRANLHHQLHRQKQEASCSSIDVLPDQCLFEVLRRLPGKKERSISACVSKRWLMLLSTICSSNTSSALGHKESLKSSKKSLPDLNGNSEDEDEEAQEIVENNDGYLSRCLEGKEATDTRLVAMAVGTGGRGGLGKLSIRGSNCTHGVTNIGLSAIARGCPSLRVLSLWNVASVDDEGLAKIAEGCPLLEKLDLCKCPLISDKGVAAIAQKCPNISSLAIESCSGIGNECLQAIGRCCPNLQSISIVDSAHVGDQGVASLVSSASPSLVKIKLQSLNITDMSLAVIGYYGRVVTDLIFSGLQNVTEKGFWVMGSAHGLQKLKFFSVTSCCVTDLGLEAIAKGCPNLKQLCLWRCCYLSDRGLDVFTAVAASLQNLRLEECNRITLIGVLAALSSCNSKLKTLALVKCTGIQDMKTFCPARVPSYLSLQSLSIRDCLGFGSASLSMFGKLCPQLQHMDLSGLLEVTDVGLLPLIEGCELGLTKVNLSGCANLTDAVISALAKRHGETLRTLNLTGCWKVTDKSLLAVADWCCRLKDLNVSKCPVTDYGVTALASARPSSMQVLSLAGCSMVSSGSLLNLGKSLVGLNLQQCNSIDIHAIRVLEERMPWCDILS